MFSRYIALSNGARIFPRSITVDENPDIAASGQPLPLVSDVYHGHGSVPAEAGSGQGDDATAISKEIAY